MEGTIIIIAIAVVWTIISSANDSNKNSEIVDELCKGKTDEQQKVIKYFCLEGGCFQSVLSDEEYEQKISRRLKEPQPKRG